MDFSHSLGEWGTEGFKDSVCTRLMELESDLPLEDFCESGGAPDPVGLADFTVDEVEEHQNEIVVTSSVSFKESIPTGCKDANHLERREGKLIIRINETSGHAEVEADPTAERGNLEYY
jgi:hypothetical protein